MSLCIINKINQILFVFFVSRCKGYQNCSISSVPLTVIKFIIILMFLEFLIKNSFRVTVPEQNSHR